MTPVEGGRRRTHASPADDIVEGLRDLFGPLDRLTEHRFRRQHRILRINLTLAALGLVAYTAYVISLIPPAQVHFAFGIGAAAVMGIGTLVLMDLRFRAYAPTPAANPDKTAAREPQASAQAHAAPGLVVPSPRSAPEACLQTRERLGNPAPEQQQREAAA